MDFIICFFKITAGLSTFAMGVAENYTQLLVYSGLYGIFEGGYASQVWQSFVCIRVYQAGCVCWTVCAENAV